MRLKIFWAFRLILLVLCAPACALESSWPSVKEIDISAQIQECRRSLQKHASNNTNVLKMFDQIIAVWEGYYFDRQGNFDLCSLLKATTFAAIKHEGQYREGTVATPYIIHPMGVAKSLWEEGKIRSVNVLAAALLHDTLEDTATTKEELDMHFGQRVRMTVEELTDDPSLTSEEKRWKQVEHAPQLSLNAQLVKLADRLYNIHDLRNLGPEERKKSISYLRSSLKLLKALEGTQDDLENSLRQKIEAQL